MSPQIIFEQYHQAASLVLIYADYLEENSKIEEASCLRSLSGISCVKHQFHHTEEQIFIAFKFPDGYGGMGYNKNGYKYVTRDLNIKTTTPYYLWTFFNKESPDYYHRYRHMNNIETLFAALPYLTKPLTQ